MPTLSALNHLGQFWPLAMRRSCRSSANALTPGSAKIRFNSRLVLDIRQPVTRPAKYLILLAMNSLPR